MECRQRFGWHLYAHRAGVTVLTMYGIARLFQMIGLTIPPLAIIAQLMERITLGQMLGFLVASITIFGIGYVIQRYSGAPPA